MISAKTSAILSRVLAHHAGAEPSRVQGLSGSARAALLSLLTDGGIPWLVICPDQETAQTLQADWAALSEVFLGRSPIGAVLSEWESSPYSAISPSLKTRLQRSATLFRVAVAPESLAIIFTTPQALLQRCLPRALWTLAGFALQSGATLERSLIAKKLGDAGYQRVDTVEDPGTFALRGEILDLFPPGEDQPVRIELFDQMIEKMRPFDPSSQKIIQAAGTLETVLVSPAREVLVNAQTTKTIRERIKIYADDNEIPRTQRDPILNSIVEGSYNERSDFWASFAEEGEFCALNYMPEGTLQSRVIWIDSLGALQNWDAELQRLKQDFTKKSNLLVPEPSRLFALSENHLERLSLSAALHIEQVHITENLNRTPTAQEDTEPERSLFHIQSDGHTELSAIAKNDLSHWEPKFALWAKQGFKVSLFCSGDGQKEKVQFLLSQRGITGVSLYIANLSEGFKWPAQGWIALTDAEILGVKRGKARPQRKTASTQGTAVSDWAGLQELSDLSPGDAVVHVDHGIGRYLGLSRLDSGDGALSDFLQLEYANKDKLYIPVYRMGVIQKYVGSGDSIALDRLGSGAFLRAKEKVKEAVKRLAFDLVELYAQRQLARGAVFSPRDELLREFEAKFPFDETADQWKAVDATLDDLSSGRIMDRLICGDVGYGKTEVAMRAAFRVASEGKQVAVLVPTTVLATQHELSFRARFAGWPMRIASLSRFRTPSEQKKILSECAEGKIDILIGTHRLLSKDLQFKDLGLVIVDEEHRFGVEHKERLKTLRVNSHVLTLSATPIPRTLNMALSGLREITLMSTPPVDRLPIRTYVAKQDEDLIRKAIEFELKRGGQVFYLHNRVQSIYECVNRLREIVPEATIAVGHGQLSEKELESAMLAFYEKRAQILVCTSIIESGLDVPTANTLIVERADLFGLAQLYQIRGRVGRAQNRGYAYLLVPSETTITEDSKKRLEVIQRFVELGSGFSVASHDLEIRGGGDLLGAQQSGHIASVGFDLYTELLDEAIREIQGRPQDPAHEHREPEIKVPYPAFLSETYVPDIHQRLSLYRRLSGSPDEDALVRVEGELQERFGALPMEARNLVWLIRLKILLKRFGLDALTAGPERVALVPGQNSSLRPERAVALLAAHPKDFQITPDSKIVLPLRATSLQELYLKLDALLQRLSQ